MVRPTRVVYVENDPALRGILTSMLRDRPEMELIGSASSSDEAMVLPHIETADVALLDLALGPDSLTGTELGMVLRERNPNMGVVIFTQHVVPDFLGSLPEQYRWGWSSIEKRGNIDMDYLVDVLRSTARGLNIVDPNMALARARADASVIDLLSPRQREIMALAATGLDATAIAESLGSTPSSVRQELSRAYSVLVPNPKPGTDLRTSAVLRYLRETRAYADQADEH